MGRLRLFRQSSFEARKGSLLRMTFAL